MKTVYSLNHPITDQPVVLTIGKFDCVHLGHQLVIRTVVERARSLGYQSVVMTFDPHPFTVVFPDRELRLLTSVEERAALIAGLGVDICIVAPFTRETMHTPAEVYMRQLCSVLPLRELWVGDNFALGRNREGDVARLHEIGRDLGYTVTPVTRLQARDEVVSTSRVRHLLSQGRVEDMESLLGRPFALQGVVERGDQRGQTIGFPTANLAIAPGRALPADGVYACCAAIGQQQDAMLPAVTNIGLRPTVDGMRRTVEAHLLNWSGNLYGQVLRLQFLHYLRGEQKFGSLEELTAQIARDAERARQLLTG